MNLKIKLAIALTIGVCGFGLLSFVSPAGSEEFVIVRTMESHGTISYPNLMVVTYSMGENRSIKLEKIKKNGENSVENIKKITSMISEIKSNGYELTDFSGGGGVYGVTYQYHFKKK
jgi:hypothetical protein